MQCVAHQSNVYCTVENKSRVTLILIHGTAHRTADTTFDLECIGDWALAAAPPRGAELATVSGGPGGCRPSPSGAEASRQGRIQAHGVAAPARRAAESGLSGAERSGERGDSVAVTMRSWRDVAVAGRAGPRCSLTSSYVNVPELNLWFLQ